MRNNKAKLQRENVACRSVGTRYSSEVLSQSSRIDQCNIVRGRRVPAAVDMPRTRRTASHANTPSTGWSSITSSNRIKTEFNQTAKNGNKKQPRKRQQMKTLLQKHNEVMPCMTGLDRVVNWKLSSECNDVCGYNKDLDDSMSGSIRSSSIQERISYDKVLPANPIDHQSANLNYFKVPATIHPKANDTFSNLTTDESSKSATTTSQEELYSYLGVVTKSQTSKPDTDAETKTVKRSSLRVKVKQIALRNQEIYNRLSSGKKDDICADIVNNVQTIVRYNGDDKADLAMSKSSRKGQLIKSEPSINHSANTTYGTKNDSTNNQTNKQPNISSSAPQSINYNRVNMRRTDPSQNRYPLQMVPYSFHQRPMNKCTSMERFNYNKRPHDSEPVYVNHKKYKPTNVGNTPDSVRHISNGVDNTQIQQPTVSQSARSGNEFVDHSYAKRNDKRSYKASTPAAQTQGPRVTAHLKLIAQQITALANSNRSTAINGQGNIQSSPERPHRTRSSTGVIIKPKPRHSQNIGSKNVPSTQRIPQSNISTNKVSSSGLNSSQNIGSKVKLQGFSQQNVGNSDNFTSSTSTQQSIAPLRSINSRKNTGSTNISSEQARLQNVYPTNTSSQQNVGTKNVAAQEMSSRQKSDSSRKRLFEAHSLQNISPSNDISSATSSKRIIGDNIVSSHGMNSRRNINISTLQNIGTKCVPLATSSQRNIGQESVSSSEMSSLENITVNSVHNSSTRHSVLLPTSSQRNMSEEMSSKRNLKVSSLQNIEFERKTDAANEFSNRAISRQNIKVASHQDFHTNSLSALPTSSQQNIDTNMISYRGVTSRQSVKYNTDSSLQIHPLKGIITSHESLETSSQHSIESINVHARQTLDASIVSPSPTTAQQNTDRTTPQNIENLPEIVPSVSPQNVSIEVPSLQSISNDHLVALPKESQQNLDSTNALSTQSIGSMGLSTSSLLSSLSTSLMQNIYVNEVYSVPEHSMQNNDINTVLPVSEENVVQLAITIPPKDLNENVAKVNESKVPVSPKIETNVVESEADEELKTNSTEISTDNIKPDLTESPISSEISTPTTDTAPEIYPNFNRSDSLVANSDTYFLRKDDGEILSVISHVKQLVVIQERLISFWSLPSMLYSIFGMVQRYVCIGKKKRDNCDIDIDAPYQCRLLTVGRNASYVELRAKTLTGSYTRDCLTSIYLNVYLCDDQQQVTLRHIECDRFHGLASTIRYTILPNSGSFVVSWTEGLHNLNRYNLNLNLTNVESILPFPAIQKPLKSLHIFENDKLIGFGYSTITIWESRTGDVTLKIDMDVPIGENLAFFSLNENTERALILIQLFESSNDNVQLIKLMAINMKNHLTWKVISTHEMTSDCAKIASTAIVNNHLITTYENGQSFLLNLYNPKQFVTCSSQPKESKLFVIKDKLITINNNELTVKTFVDHFFG